MSAVPLIAALAMATALLDQATKRLATARLAEGAPAGTFGLRRTVNARASTLTLSPVQAAAAWLVAAACAGVVVAVASPLPAAAACGLGLALGGAAGNLADRFARGGVLDFIALGRWPAFNVADAAMTCGLALAAWSLLL